MRQVLRAELLNENSNHFREMPTHFGYAYDLLGPPPADGSSDAAMRSEWLECCEKIEIDPDYKYYFKFATSGFPVNMKQVVKAESRILIGAGTASSGEVGLTVHRAWGVPILPGTALKGLLAHYVDAVYGSDDDAEPEYRAWRGPSWIGHRPAMDRPQGSRHAQMFGSAALSREEPGRRGGVVFHDALFVPDSIKKPYARDVLTPHQVSYYRGQGKVLPNDWDSPIPVGFITVRPGAQFLLAVTGDDDWAPWAERALDLLLEALAAWGIGGKTSAGYGRLTRHP